MQKGATITASEWSVSGGYSGKVYTTETINNLGGYTISSTELQGILDVRAYIECPGCIEKQPESAMCEANSNAVLYEVNGRSYRRIL